MSYRPMPDDPINYLLFWMRDVIEEHQAEIERERSCAGAPTERSRMKKSARSCKGTARGIDDAPNAETMNGVSITNAKP